MNRTEAATLILEDMRKVHPGISDGRAFELARFGGDGWKSYRPELREAYETFLTPGLDQISIANAVIAGLNTAGFNVSPILGDGPDGLHVIVTPDGEAEGSVWIRFSEGS